jgi:hypothetical protein
MISEPKESSTNAADRRVLATCHCGDITVSLASAPSEVTDCNCSLCRKSGVLWAYYAAGGVTIAPDSGPTDTYAWNGRHVDFHRCCNCGRVTHWGPRDLTRDLTRERRGINARLLQGDVLSNAKVRQLNGASTGKYVD